MADDENSGRRDRAGRGADGGRRFTGGHAGRRGGPAEPVADTPTDAEDALSPSRMLLRRSTRRTRMLTRQMRSRLRRPAPSPPRRSRPKERRRAPPARREGPRGKRGRPRSARPSATPCARRTRRRARSGGARCARRSRQLHRVAAVEAPEPERGAQKVAPGDRRLRQGGEDDHRQGRHLAPPSPLPEDRSQLEDAPRARREQRGP